MYFLSFVVLSLLMKEFLMICTSLDNKFIQRASLSLLMKEFFVFQSLLTKEFVMFCTSLDNKFYLESLWGKGNTFMAGKFFRSQSKGMLQVFNQQFGTSLRASPYCSMVKTVFVGPVFFERSSSQDAGSDKDDTGRYRGKFDMAATTHNWRLMPS